MEPQSVSPTEMRVIIALLGLVVLGVIYLLGRKPKAGSGKRFFSHGPRDRIEPVLGDDGAVTDEPAPSNATATGVEVVRPGVRPHGDIERIVTVYVAARAGSEFTGADVVVAAEKTGLVFGDRGVFHRLVPGTSPQGPLFSMASMVQPGSFDMTTLDSLRTPGLSLFMTLPGPMPALDAWDTLLPAAQRLAELLDGAILDEQRNTLGRQRIAHLRDELRAWDRRQDTLRVRGEW